MIKTHTTALLRRGPSVAAYRVFRQQVALVTLLAASCGWAQPVQPAPSTPNAPYADDQVAATVNDIPIYWGDVQRQVDRVLRGRATTPEAMERLRQTARQQLISRELILLYLKRHEMAPSTDDISVEIGRITKRLALEEKTLEDYLAKAKMTRPQLERLLKWQLGWQWYLDRFLTDANLEKYFNDHRVEFDGSKMQVAHILFKANPADPQAVEAATAKAKQLREQLAQGELDFSEAAQKHSQSPTAKNGGDIGMISRHEPMPEPFSKAAFALKPMQISQPVVSPFGVHLIQCLKIEPGQRKWSDVREALRVSVTAYLFQWVADQQRAKAKIVLK